MATKKLTPKQERFCQEYLIDLNATQSAIRAGYSAKTAHSHGPRLLENVGVRDFISELKSVRSEATGIKAKWVLDRLANIADFDIRKLFDENGNLLPINQLEPETAFALSSIDIGEMTTGDDFISLTKKIKAADKIKALELIGRHLGMFTERIEHTGGTSNVMIYIPDNGRDRPIAEDDL